MSCNKLAILFRFVFTLLAAFVVASISCGCSGKSAAQSKPRPTPLLISFCDRSRSVNPDEWAFHMGLIKIVSDEFGYDKKISTKIYLFGRAMGLAYDGYPEDWEAIAGPLNEYVKNGNAMKGQGTYAAPVFRGACGLAEVNLGHPVFIIVASDGLFNDIDKARGELRNLLEHDNVKVLIVGPYTKNAELRLQYEAQLMPGPQPEKRVQLKSRDDIESDLRTAAADFKKSYLPDEE